MYTRLTVRDEFVDKYNVRSVMGAADSGDPNARKRSYEHDNADPEVRKREKRYPCEDSWLTPSERSQEVCPPRHACISDV